MDDVVAAWFDGRGIPTTVGWTDDGGMTQLLLACADNNQQVCEWLLHNGHPIDAPSDNSEGRRPFHNILVHNHLELAKWFVNEGSKFCVSSTEGGAHHSPSAAPFYLSPNNKKSTPLAYVAQNGTLDTFKWAVDTLGCQLEGLQEDDRTIAMWASTNMRTTDILKYIILGDDDTTTWLSPKTLDDVTSDGKTVAHIAAIAGNLPAIQFLLDKVDFNKVDASGMNVLMTSISKCHLELSTWLVEHGFSFPTKQAWPNNRSAVSFPARAGRVDMLEWLIDQCGCDNRPLGLHNNDIAIHAAICGQINILQWLYTRVDMYNWTFHHTNTEGLTVIDAAASFGHFATVAWLHCRLCISNCCKLRARRRDPKADGKCSLQSPMTYAIVGGELQTLKKLHDVCEGGSEDYCEDFMYQAVVGGFVEIVEWLLRTFPKPAFNQLMNDRSILTGVVTYGKVDTLEWLLYHSGDGNGIVSPLLSTVGVLTLARNAISEDRLEVLKFMDRTALINFATRSKALLRLAGSRGKLRCFKWLLKRSHSFDYAGGFDKIRSFLHPSIMEWIGSSPLNVFSNAY